MKYLSYKFNILLVSLFLGIACCLLQSLFGHSWITTSGHAFGSDDAYISFRYAENLFSGNGIVFNKNEFVEGYSNFLYVLLLVPFFLFGSDYIYIYSIFLNIIFLLISIILFWKFINEIYGLNYANVGSFFLAFNPWIWINIATGLETSLMLLATLGLFISLHSQNSNAPLNRNIYIFSILLILIRVDGFIIPFIAFIYIFFRLNKYLAFRVLLTILITLLFHTFFRYFYYDDFISNTFYNKVSVNFFHRLSRGISYFLDNFFKTGLFLVLVIFIFDFFKSNSFRLFLKNISFSYFFIFSFSLYFIFIGGDIYYERFFVPIFPVIIFVILTFIFNLKFNKFYFIYSLIVIFSLFYFFSDNRFDWSYRKYDMWIALGNKLKESDKDSTLAIDAAGKVPFISRLHTIDMLGLNDKHIGKMKSSIKGMPGHEKFDSNYILSKTPTYIAAWINPNFDMLWGLNKEKYLYNYNLKYLVNSTRSDLGDKNIIDVSDFNLINMQELINNGYTYGVLAKKTDRSTTDQLPLHIGKIHSGTTYYHNTNHILFEGWSYPEDQHRWSSNLVASFLFNIDFIEGGKNSEGKIVLSFYTFSKQRVELILNGKIIYSGIPLEDSSNGLVIPFDSYILVNGLNKLQFNLPDARIPGNGDQRVLALSLKSFKIQW
jgi:arabinofuranosyltransferase